MEIDNATPLAAATTLGLGPDKVPCLTVVLKGTFRIPDEADQTVTWDPEQAPVRGGDETYDHSEIVITRLEGDLVPFKPRADIVLVGTAYAPFRRPVRTLDVMLRVGRLQKYLRVTGDRRWLFPSRMVMVPVMSEPEPFAEMPLTYDRAFGGIDGGSGTWFSYNYAGRGFIGAKNRETVNEKPLPNIEDPQHLIRSWDDTPLPAGFGYLGYHWQPRVRYMGTEKGIQQPHPVFGLPADFDVAFYNGAHPHLQVTGYLKGDEAVELVNLSPRGTQRFQLPGLRPVVQVRQASPDTLLDALLDGTATYSPTLVPTNLDTLVLLPDERRLYLVWRAALPLPTVHATDDLERAVLGIGRILIRLPGA